MFIKKEISAHANDFQSLCEKYKVKSLYAFGSSVTDHFNPNTSDIDLIAEIDEKDPIQRGEYIMCLWDSLEAFFLRKVDLLTNTIRNPFLKKNIEATKILIYDGTRKKIFV
jgi:predicted nucleotidyltransferase